MCAKLRYAYQQEPLLSTAKLLEYARVETTTGYDHRFTLY